MTSVFFFAYSVKKKQLLDLVFVMSKIIKVLVRVSPAFALG